METMVSAIVLIMVIWSSSGGLENRKTVQVEIMESMQQCQMVGKSFMEQAVADTANISAASWECRILSSREFQRGASWNTQ